MVARGPGDFDWMTARSRQKLARRPIDRLRGYLYRVPVRDGQWLHCDDTDKSLGPRGAYALAADVHAIGVVSLGDPVILAMTPAQAGCQPGVRPAG